MLNPTVKCQNVPEPDVALTERLFEILAKETADTLGVTQEAYGRSEQFAHDIVATEARKVGLPVTGNMCIRLAGSKRNPRIDLGPLTESTPAVMDRQLLDLFGVAMDRIGVPRCEMARGAGYDAAVFSGTGVPTLMLFVRDQSGSHNPDEEMEMADFAVVTRFMAQGLALVS